MRLLLAVLLVGLLRLEAAAVPQQSLARVVPLLVALRAAPLRRALRRRQLQREQVLALQALPPLTLLMHYHRRQWRWR